MKCEKCSTETNDAKTYGFNYGKLINTSSLTTALGRTGSETKTTYTYRMMGSQDVILCQSCVVREATRYAKRQAIFFPIGVLLLFGFISLLISVWAGLPALANLGIFVVPILLFIFLVSFPLIIAAKKAEKVLENNDLQKIRNYIHNDGISKLLLGGSLNSLGDTMAIALYYAEKTIAGYDGFWPYTQKGKAFPENKSPLP
jgi:hypothetical protein